MKIKMYIIKERKKKVKTKLEKKRKKKRKVKNLNIINIIHFNSCIKLK